MSEAGPRCGHDGPAFPLPVDRDRFFLVFALTTPPPGMSTRPKLTSVHALLASVVESARQVVKGTHSQRRFNAQFTEFVRTTLVVLPDLEEAAFEWQHPGRRASEAAEEEIAGIQERNLVKELAGFVASQSTTLTMQYLEHVGLGALSKFRQQQSRKRDHTSLVTEGSNATLSRRLKKEETVGSDNIPPIAPLEPLGLLDEAELIRTAMEINGARSHMNSTCDGPDASALKVDRSITVDENPPGVYTSGKDGCRYDLRSVRQKLSVIPELGQRLHPWTIPQAFTGLVVNRVTTEKEKRPLRSEGGPLPSLTPHCGGRTHSDEQLAVRSLLEVCLAPGPTDLLRLWEEREASVATPLPSTSIANCGAQRRRRGLSPPQLGGNSPQQAPQKRHQPRSFFPCLDVTCYATVPISVMKELVHNGVSHLEFLH